MATIDALRDLLWARDGGLCGICYQPVARSEMQMDHITPRAKGGADAFDNLRPAHFLCNVRRGDGRERIAWAHFLVRLPAGLHAYLKQSAATKGQSMNTLMNAVLEVAAAQAERKGEIPPDADVE